VRKHAACRCEQLVTQLRAETGSSFRQAETQVLCSSPQRIEAATAVSPQIRSNMAAAAIARLARDFIEMALFFRRSAKAVALLTATPVRSAPAQESCSIRRAAGRGPSIRQAMVRLADCTPRF
jgi:hypothetical protein